MTKLTDRDLETLGELIFAYDQHLKRMGGGDTAVGLRYDGVAPLDFGGSNGSHHGATATKLARLGMAEHRKRGWDWGQAPTAFRGSKVYRPTTAGREAYQAWREAGRA